MTDEQNPQSLSSVLNAFSVLLGRCAATAHQCEELHPDGKVSGIPVTKTQAAILRKVIQRMEEDITLVSMALSALKEQTEASIEKTPDAGA